MKKLTLFFVKSFIGPFIATFFISMFMLVMQFLWKYIDDLMGKGLEVSIILELLFYVSASLLPLALPLAILLSSLIIMGNLGENFELTALKSSGLSIYRILRPLFIITVLISIATFYFTNYVIPIANYKWHSIIWDINEKKMSSFLRPGIYTQELDGLSLKIKDIKDNNLKDIIIHDRTETGIIKTIVADSGEYYQSENGEFLFFKLYEGNVFEELKESPNFDSKNKRKANTYSSRKSNFKTATYKMDMSGFKLQRTKDDLFKNDYEMLNVFQINEVADSIRGLYNELKTTLAYNAKRKHSYFQPSLSPIERKQDSTKTHLLNRSKKSAIVETKPLDSTKIIISEMESNQIAEVKYTLDEMTEEIKPKVINSVKSKLRDNIQTLEAQLMLLENRVYSMKRYEIEFHRKFTISFSIIVLFLIGAPLGAIVKRGGFGAPVVIAALLFMIFYVLITMGEEMTKNDILSPLVGMWLPIFILLPIAFFLLHVAANDGNFKVLNNSLKRRKKDA